MTNHDHHDDFGGLHRDLLATGAAMDRRVILRLAARLGVGVGALQMLGCGGSPTAASDTTSTSTTTTGTTSTSCGKIPEETQGPYPGDGSNGPNVLGLTGVVRSDIRSSFAGLSGTADGVPLAIALTIVSATTCSPLSGRAVYIWHCDRQGRYSLYSSGATNQNYLRGVQEADSNGRVTFTSIFPAC
jgi:protocatechuate 3,4-dioxygenase beta subunit